jgi:hypothetical protein
MSPSKLIVCEKSPRWAIALRRVLGTKGVVVVETRSLPACGREMRESPHSILAIETSPSSLESVLAAWADWSRRDEMARLVALGDSSLLPAEFLLREAGVIAIGTSIRQAGRVARLAEKHLSQAPRPNLPLREAIWQRLPWQRFASPVATSPA